MFNELPPLRTKLVPAPRLSEVATPAPERVTPLRESMQALPDVLADAVPLVNELALPPGTVSVPSPARALEAWRAAGLDNVAINHHITRTYEDYGFPIQARIDPAFDWLDPQSTRTYPNWFAMGAHPSAAAGDAITVANRLRVLFDEQTEGRKLGTPHQYHAAAEALLQAMRDVDFGALRDPRVSALSSVRFLELLHSAPGKTVPEKLDAFTRTMESLFAEGNQTIFADIAESGARYQRYAAENPVASPERLFERLQVPGSKPADAKLLYAGALANVLAGRRPTDVTELLPAQFTGEDAVVASLALYEKAALTPDPGSKNDLVLMANCLLTLHEQRDLAGPVMNPGVAHPGEVDRRLLMRLLTPTMQASAGGSPWRFADYAHENLPKNGKDPLVPRSAEYNWADLQTRMSAIWNFFEQIGKPANVGAVWNQPRGSYVDITARS